MFLNSRLLRPVWFLLSLFFFGTIGYVLLEGWSVMDAFYMTTLTLTTTGFGETNPLTNLGRIYTSILMIAGIGGTAFGFSVISENVFSIRIRRINWERRMQKKIDRLEGHVIICGYGRVGKNAADVLRNEGKTVVVVDPNHDLILEVWEEDPELLAIEGDCTDDEVLHQVGVTRAESILICTENDRDNLFIVLSVRALDSDINIIVRATEFQSEKKMMRAGANQVISPYRIGGQRMAGAAVRPGLIDLMEVITVGMGVELWMEDIILSPDSPVVGSTVGDAHIRGETGVTIVMINRKGANLITPGGDTILRENDHLVVIGTKDQVQSLEKMVLGKRADN